MWIVVKHTPTSSDHTIQLTCCCHILSFCWLAGVRCRLADRTCPEFEDMSNDPRDLSLALSIDIRWRFEDAEKPFGVLPEQWSREDLGSGSGSGSE